MHTVALYHLADVMHNKQIINIVVEVCTSTIHVEGAVRHAKESHFRLRAQYCEARINAKHMDIG